MLFTTNVQTSLIKPITEVFISSVKTCSKLISSLMGANQSVLKMMPPNVSKSGEENTIPYKNDEEFVVVENPNPIELNINVDFYINSFGFNYLINLYETEANRLSNDLAILHYADRNNLTVWTLPNLRITIFKKVDGEATNKEIISKRIAFLEERIKALELKMFKDEVKELQIILNGMEMSLDSDDVSIESAINIQDKMQNISSHIEELQKNITKLEQLKKEEPTELQPNDYEKMILDLKKEIKKLQFTFNKMEMCLDSDDVSIESAINIQYKMLEIPKEIEKLKKRITELEQLKEDSASFVIITKLRD